MNAVATRCPVLPGCRVATCRLAQGLLQLRRDVHQGLQPLGGRLEAQAGQGGHQAAALCQAQGGQQLGGNQVNECGEGTRWVGAATGTSGRRKGAGAQGWNGRCAMCTALKKIIKQLLYEFLIKKK